MRKREATPRRVATIHRAWAADVSAIWNQALVRRSRIRRGLERLSPPRGLRHRHRRLVAAYGEALELAPTPEERFDRAAAARTEMWSLADLLDEWPPEDAKYVARVGALLEESRRIGVWSHTKTAKLTWHASDRLGALAPAPGVAAEYQELVDLLRRYGEAMTQQRESLEESDEQAAARADAEVIEIYRRLDEAFPEIYKRLG
jgi:hypothetical protein